MKTYIAKSDAEAKALHDGTQTELVIAMERQPPAWCRLYWPPYEGDEIVCVHQSGESFSWKAPYQSGDVIAVKEAWAYANHCEHYNHLHNGPVLYRARDITCSPKRWRSARQMASYNVRTHLRCESVNVQQIDGKWCWQIKVRLEDNHE